MGRTQLQLIEEEQKILDVFLSEIKNRIQEISKEINGKKIINGTATAEAVSERKLLRSLLDDLYHTRLVLNCSDDYGKPEEIELKVGLHGYLYGGRQYVWGWTSPVCRHYLLDNAALTHTEQMRDKYGEIYSTEYRLQLKRSVEILFEKVKSVIQSFPIEEDEIESIIADEFLMELLKRRSGTDFENIVFSIQKRQGEIIQTPFEQNLIVQGCAGSGKSMIMLHRLPIVIYDHPKELPRENLYIITPSKTYMQMAKNMRSQLEISDIRMGTAMDYYISVIERYGYKRGDCGKIDKSIRLTETQRDFIYSKRMISFIIAE